jgi:hypothetical protein
VEQGTTTLRFCPHTMIAGIGTAVRISAEIARTLTQFPSIKRVVILDDRIRVADARHNVERPGILEQRDDAAHALLGPRDHL